MSKSLKFVKTKKTQVLSKCFLYLFLATLGISMIFPFLWMIVTSVKNPDADIMDLTKFWPDKFYWDNYIRVLKESDFFRAFMNSIFVTVTVTVGQVFTSSLAAYAFARLKFFGRDKIFLGYLATMMVPATVTMIPIFILLREMNLINTYHALILPSMFSAYGTFMLRQFFLSLPSSLEEAATIDGCSALGVYWHIILPLSKPALAALSILTFMGAWRSFMWPIIVTHSKELYTLPVALAKFNEQFGVQWTLLMAGSIIMILPMLIIFIVGQKYFIEGICVGAVKG